MLRLRAPPTRWVTSNFRSASQYRCWVRRRPATLRRGSRAVFTEAITSIPAPLVPPLAFTGFLVSLWLYKCVMLVVFQNKIIYMPGLPPGARSETIQDYQSQCGNCLWEEKRIKSLDGTEIALAIGRSARSETRTEHHAALRVRKLVLLYFQGNGASILPRLPQLSRALDAIQVPSGKEVSLDITLIALSYRGYWTSRGKPSQAGIEQDAVSALQYIQLVHPNASIILWGQSIGAGVATTLLANRLAQQADTSSVDHSPPRIAGLVLETPFASIKSMLVALYPQKWLPYRYLHPFLRSHWDSGAALRQITADRLGRKIPILMLIAAKDELVPITQSEHLAATCREGGMDVRKTVVPGALHVDVMNKKEGRRAIAEFVRDLLETRSGTG